MLSTRKTKESKEQLYNTLSPNIACTSTSSCFPGSSRLRCCFSNSLFPSQSLLFFLYPQCPANNKCLKKCLFPMVD